jgi:hypothetical protein
LQYFLFSLILVTAANRFLTRSKNFLLIWILIVAVERVRTLTRTNNKTKETFPTSSMVRSKALELYGLEVATRD